MEHRAVRDEALVAGEERRGRRRRPEERSVFAESTGLIQLSWTLPVRDPQGEAAEIRFEPARIEPAEVAGPVPLEWAREAMRLMLAMEKAFHRMASGAPLQLHYPPAVPAPIVQPQGHPRAAPRRPTARPAPQKGKGKAPVAVRRRAKTTQPETRGVVIGPPGSSPLPQRELRKRPAQKRPAEGPAKKKRREGEESEDEDEDEEGEESTSLSSGSGSASDPGFRVPPRGQATDEEDDDDDTDSLDDE